MRKYAMQRLMILTVAATLAALTAPAQDWAKARLDKSPRHLEYVTVKSGNREVKCFIAFPEVKEKATAVVVIHEIFGLSDWVRGVTDQLAEAGYIAIAPDFLTGMPGARGGGGARESIGSLPADQITGDLNAVVDYVSKLPSCNGKVVVAGFCWGGRQSFRFATNNKDVKAAFVFYGDAPAEAEIARVTCPVYGFYGEMDARITAAVPKTSEQMRSAKKTYEPEIYKGAGHGFMRDGEGPPGDSRHDANVKAREDAWTRWKDLLKKI
jgi:carboxymethylenebutenolidase